MGRKSVGTPPAPTSRQEGVPLMMSRILVVSSLFLGVSLVACAGAESGEDSASSEDDLSVVAATRTPAKRRRQSAIAAPAPSCFQCTGKRWAKSRAVPRSRCVRFRRGRAGRRCRVSGVRVSKPAMIGVALRKARGLWVAGGSGWVGCHRSVHNLRTSLAGCSGPPRRRHSVPGETIGIRVSPPGISSVPSCGYVFRKSRR